MPAITTLIAIAGVAASVGGVMQAQSAAAAQAAAAKKQADQAKAALQAKRPSTDTAAKVALAKSDKRKLRRGKGSQAKKNRAALQAGGLASAGQSASAVGGL